MMMTTQLSIAEIKANAHQFVKTWEAEDSERAEAQSFWNDFFTLFGLNRRKVGGIFERSAQRLTKNDGRIDLFWPGMLLAEHKSAGQPLDKASVQAFEYLHSLNDKEYPRLIIISDFQRFVVYDLELQTETAFTLAELPEKLHLFLFIAGYGTRIYKDEDPVNLDAAERIGKLHDQLIANGYTGKNLELLMVRLLFCFFAEDTGIFNKDDFLYYIENNSQPNGKNLEGALASLFNTLDTAEEKRHNTLAEDLQLFPYVNGSLFTETLRLPPFDTAMRNALLYCCALDWSKVSPAIFGSLFQAVMNKADRRQLGAHYTSEKNVLKLIDDLFLDALKADIAKALATKGGNRRRLLEAKQAELAQLKFLDPACGCGNFLVITYRELRKLEHQLIEAILADEEREAHGVIQKKTVYESKLNVDQFFGIEKDELPSQIAKVALWLTDHQMNMALSAMEGLPYARIPLTTEPNIRCGNALRMDWDTAVCPRETMSYILGNPPFVGKQVRTKEQTEDMGIVFADHKNAKSLDYVTCWYVKATNYMYGTKIHCGLVSTNSITQGEQVSILWRYLLNKGITLTFAHRTFKWTNEAKGKAAVYCVMIGFAYANTLPPTFKKRLWDYPDVKGEGLAKTVVNINPYLIEMNDLVVDSQTKPICNVAEIIYGSKPTDGGNLILDDEAYQTFIMQYPDLKPLVKVLMGAEEFINNIPRYCLWLKEVDPKVYRNCKFIVERLEQVKKMRLSSPKAPTQKLASQPHLFGEIRFFDGDYLAIPSISSESRFYIPMAFLNNDIVLTNKMYYVPNATLYDFGVLTSALHMAWTRVVTGRLENRYQYSNKLVYNNFPWPTEATPSQKAKIEAFAQAVLDARQPFLDRGNTLADLYNPLTMPPELLKAHQALDKAVDGAYGKKSFVSELERVQFLFERYEALVKPLMPTAVKASKRKAKC
ncbi:MAG: N-6 DNA methylase [Candidatus Melainabacteria bacterium]|nr:N-6 DNA methylase [Candidatus Melainabacteria bacterium]